MPLWWRSREGSRKRVAQKIMKIMKLSESNFHQPALFLERRENLERRSKSLQDKLNIMTYTIERRAQVRRARRRIVFWSKSRRKMLHPETSADARARARARARKIRLVRLSLIYRDVSCPPQLPHGLCPITPILYYARCRRRPESLPISMCHSKLFGIVLA